MILFTFLLIALLAHYKLSFNISPSMPLGLYFKSHSAIQRGDIVAVCLQNPYKALGLQQHYLITSHGICHGTMPLMKQLIAIPGDQVKLTNESIQVNDKTYLYPTHRQDSKNRPLAVFPRGDYPNTTGYWLLGTNNPQRSWDSRYWGFVQKEQIPYRFISLIVW